MKGRGGSDDRSTPPGAEDAAGAAMTCEGVSAVLTPFVDGELHGDEMREVARHLVRCPACETESASLERLQRAIRGAVAGVMPDAIDANAFWQGVASGIAREAPPAPQPIAAAVRRLRAAPNQLRLVIAGGLAAGLVAALLLSGDGGRGVDGRQTPAPARNLLAQQSRIDSLAAPGNVRILNPTDSGALVIWVGDTGMAGERFEP